MVCHILQYPVCPSISSKKGTGAPVTNDASFVSSSTLFYSPEAKHSFGRIMEILYGTKNGVHAFSYNSAESEPIWMKSGAL